MIKLPCKVLLFNALWLVSAINLSGQFYIENKAIYDEAISFIDGEEYEEALPLLLMLEKKGIKNANVQFNIGLCYINIDGQKLRSKPYLAEAAKSLTANYNQQYADSAAPYETLILLGTAYRLENNFDSAIFSYQRVGQLSGDSLLQQKAEYYIKQCKTAELLLKYPADAKLTAIEDFVDVSVYNPVIVAGGQDKLIYMQKLKFYDAITRSDIDNNALRGSENITPELGSDGDMILVSASVDGNTLLFSSYDAGNGYELYYATKDEKGKWQKIKKFDKPINSAFNESSACLSYNNRTIYFSSNRPGGFGGSDIYTSNLLSDGSWSEPVNLGRMINTPQNEISPYLSANGEMLFFCSEGHMNMGGYDIFVCHKDKDNWGTPVNPGSPVSTTDNDVFVCPMADSLVLLTHRLVPGRDSRIRMYKINYSDDIYGYRLALSGTLDFNDTIPPKPVLYYVCDNSENNAQQVLKTDNEGNFSLLLSPGDYTMNFIYNEQVQATQQVSVKPLAGIHELNIGTPLWKNTKGSIEQPDLTKTDKKPVEKSVLLISIRDVLFSFDSYAINDSYKPMLDSVAHIIKNFNEIKIEVTGHADSIGNSQYNLILSEKRARAVAKYLFSAGAPADAVSAGGKGETQPVAINTNSDGSDNTLGRKFNRRVTLELKFSDQPINVVKSDSIPLNLKVE
ncbi:MAG: OmpA family protein [Bacteroidales bacterium]|nr:OmpA family protein [Bacteroidales bacterium]